MLRRLADPLRWDEVHEQLAHHPTLARCSRAEIRALCRAGDRCAIPAGEVLCREQRIGYWFFVVLAGSVSLSEDGVPRGELGAGSHFGDTAILGFGPQPLTAVARTDLVVFVVGRRAFLDLSAVSRPLQGALLPEADTARFAAHVRELRQAGDAAWRRLPQGRENATDRHDPLPMTLRVHPAKAPPPGGFDFAGIDLHRAPTPPRRSVGWGISRRAALALASLSLLAALAVGTQYHPPVLVVRPAPPIDISRDVEVRGAPTRPPSGRHLVTAVSLERPTLFGRLAASWRGERQVPVARHAEERRTAGRRQYLDSQQAAISAVAAADDRDPEGLQVEFRDRRLLGGSAGLAYTLLLADVLGDVDLGGRTVAATGVVGPEGRVLSVRYTEVKRSAAIAGDADVFLVPPDSGAAGVEGDLTVRRVRTVTEALTAVDRRPGSR